MSEDPKAFWGSSYWRMIHSSAVVYKPTPENAKAFKAMMWSLTKLLPCDVCKINLTKKLTIFPPDQYLGSNEDLFLWTYIIHDLVNKHVSKYHPDRPKVSPCYDEIKKLYFDNLGKDCSDCKVKK